MRPFLANQKALIAGLRELSVSELKGLVLLELESENPRLGHVERIVSRLGTKEKEIRSNLIKQWLKQNRK